MATTQGTGQSNAIEDYSEVDLLAAAPGRRKPASTNMLAERCGVTPASASAMVKKLAERGLAIHEPYHGVRLTDAATRRRTPTATRSPTAQDGVRSRPPTADRSCSVPVRPLTRFERVAYVAAP